MRPHVTLIPLLHSSSIIRSIRLLAWPQCLIPWPESVYWVETKASLLCQRLIIWPRASSKSYIQIISSLTSPMNAALFPDRCVTSRNHVKSCTYSTMKVNASLPTLDTITEFQCSIVHEENFRGGCQTTDIGAIRRLPKQIAAYELNAHS